MTRVTGWSRVCAAGVAVLGLIVVASPSVRAQAVYGSIAGTVIDSTGAPASGATVTVTSVSRRTVDTVSTNTVGYFEKLRLLPGAYEVRAELTGFKAKVVSAVNVSVDSQTRVDLALDLGQVTEVVVVESVQSQLLKIDRADVATTFETKQITELPILDRNFTKFVLLTPGTQRLSWNHATSENPQGSIQTMVNGQHFSGTGFQLDGTENRDPILGIIVINPTLESIGEAKVTSQNYDAEFGQATAGVVSVVTKSGTNAFHGSAFEFHQSDKFQARNPYSQPDVKNEITGRVLPETKRDQFGASLGGPVLKNQLFFFADYQGWRYKDGGSKLLTVPTALARTGDLSEYGVNIYDPHTGDPANRTQFPGNVIPAGRLSPQALAILKLLPMPNTAGTVNGTRDNYIAQGSEVFNSDAFNTRVDGRLSDRLNVFARYSFANFTKLGLSAFGVGGGPGVVDLGGNTSVKNQSLALGLDYTLSNSAILDVRFGFFKYNVNVYPNDYGTNPALDAGIPGMNFPDNKFTSGLPGGFINGNAADMEFGTALGDRTGRCNCPLLENEKQFQLVTNLTKALGSKHTAKVGIDVRRAYNLRVPSDNHRSGEIDFNAERTQGPNGGGLGLATFMLGDVSGYRRYVSSSTDAGEEQWRWFAYVQDTWRATSKLTINYGLRLEDIMPQTINAPGNAGYFDVKTGEMKVVGVGGIPMNGGIKNKINWAPRLGIAYQFDEKTVVRMGYGRSYDIGVFGSTFGHSVTQNLPVLARQTLNAPANYASVFNLSEGPPPPKSPEVGPNGRFKAPDGVNPSTLPDTQRLPYVDSWNLTIQRQLGTDVSAEVAYVGNKGTHVFSGDGPDINFNEPTLQGFPNVPRDQRRPFYQGPVGGYGASFGLTTDIRYLCNCSDNNYNSLQARVTKRFSHGYSLFGTYTLQRIRSHNNGQYFFDRSLEYGPPQWARTHVATFGATVELPFGRGKVIGTDVSSGLDYVIGGWQINATGYIASGEHLDVSYRNAGQDRDVGPNRPDVIGDITAGGGSKDRWFNATPIGTEGSAFGRPAVGTFGNMPRGSLIGPGFWNVDASLFKHLHFTDRVSLELRLEIVNVFNHVALGNPDTEVGVPGNDNPNAGRITSTAANWQPRNVQFGLRFQF
jgi:hypothetical protein